jgi:pyrimidine-nucleoside phosphorylase
MTAYEIISKKRDHHKLSDDEIRFMIDGFTNGSIPDYQTSAWLMSIFLNGMDDEETVSITQSMLLSGDVVDLSDFPGVKIDKHSTGGVGDKISIILAPIVAAAGALVPMISGRGLGHTGGTLDKLESIPGFRVDYSIAEYKKKIEKIGVCLIGQTPTLAPADKKLYALRDVTATVQSIPLITGSIMSKKLAEGIDALVLDVKTGGGAFMQQYEDSIALAKKLISVGEKFGMPTIAYITDMNEPLGYTIGNWLEIKECIDCLRGNGPSDVMELTHQLCGAMIYLGKKSGSIEEGIKRSKEMIDTGKAWDKFLEILREQNGDVEMVERPDSYPKAKHSVAITLSKDGYIASMNSLELGLISVTLGAGRQKVDDVIDPAAGIVIHKKRGDWIHKGEAVMTVYSEKMIHIEETVNRLQKAVTLSEEPPQGKKMILEYLDKNSI